MRSNDFRVTLTWRARCTKINRRLLGYYPYAFLNLHLCLISGYKMNAWIAGGRRFRISRMRVGCEYKVCGCESVTRMRIFQKHRECGSDGNRKYADADRMRMITLLSASGSIAYSRLSVAARYNAALQESTVSVKTLL